VGELGKNRVLLSSEFPEECLHDAPYETTPCSMVFETFFNPSYYLGYKAVSPGGKKIEALDVARVQQLVSEVKSSIDQNNVQQFKR